jgi:short-subunit dehydrogenase
MGQRMSTGHQASGKTAPAPPAHGFHYKHAVITGASAGIGAAVALQLACLPGITLTLIGRNVARLAAVQAACRAQGAQVSLTCKDLWQFA